MLRFSHNCDERGQTMAEYSVILAVITAAIVFTLSLLSDGIADRFTHFAGYFS
jgi:Flp pilus assembly pilin Flp